ncbi:Mur ligase family protein [Enterococcus sp. DIV0170]|uniref:Mur ligase family protein n=1 Tax=Enterococcus sp. DIV0170 TaxID=2774642 RepID=UPI003F21A280
MMQMIRKIEKSFTKDDFEQFDGYFLNESIIPSLQITNFEYTGKNMRKMADSQTAFISLTKEQLRTELGEASTWSNPYQFEQKDLLEGALYITETPIEELFDTVPQFIVPNSLMFLYQVAIFLREQTSIPVIASTGFAGMTITRMMIDHLFLEECQILSNQSSQNTRIELPCFLTKLIQSPDILNVEVSSNALDSQSKGSLSRLVHPTIAVVTAIRFADGRSSQELNTLADDVASLFNGLDDQGIAIINQDIPSEQREIVYLAAKNRTNRIFTYSMTRSSADMHLLSLKELKDITEVTASYHGERYTYYLRSSSLEIVENSLATLLILKTMEVDPDQYLERFSSFYAFPRLMERNRGYIDGKKVDIINDTHMIDPPSMINAVTSFTNKIDYYRGEKIVILGSETDLGRAEERLAHCVNGSQADLLLGYGEGLRKFVRSIDIPALWFPTIDDCIEEMFEQLKEDSLILIKGPMTHQEHRELHSFVSRFMTKTREGKVKK